ncbi:hypothetical protein BYT27DRAFT_7044660, partial [Phlegmacium glaucopus]
MGIADESKGIRVYWPDKKSVSTERNVYYDKTGSSVSRFEGEEWDGFETKTYQPQVQSQPLPTQAPVKMTIPDTPDPQNDPIPIESQHESEDEQPNVSSRPKRLRKPTQRVRDLLSGKAVTSDLPRAPKISTGIQLPTNDIGNSTAALFEEEEEAWTSEINLSEEYSLAAEISEVEALEPQTLKEAKSRPDW